MKIIRLLIQSSKLLFVVAAISSALTGLCSAMVIRMIVESIQVQEFDQSAFVLEFSLYLVGYGALAIVSSFSIAKLSQGIIHKLRIQLSNKVLDSDFVMIESSQSELFPILTEDIKTIVTGIDRMPSVTTGLATVLGVLVYMIWSSPILSVVVMGLFIVVFTITVLTLPMVKKYQEKARSLWNDLFVQFEGLIYGIKELSLNNEFKNRYVKELIAPTSLRQNSFMVKESVVIAMTSKLGDMFMLFGIGVVIVFIYQTHFIQPQEFGNYLTLVLFVVSPLMTVTGWFGTLKRVEVALDQIKKVGIELGSDLGNINSDFPETVDKARAEIELKGIKHSYYNPDEDEYFELGPIDLKIKQGELIFLLGGNGSGKTTLAKILLGLYQANEGSIKYYGEEVDNEHLSSYRNKFAATFVDSYLFDNLLHIGAADLTAKGNELLKTLELTKKVKIENSKLSTVRLSAGQKKRLGLFTAILEDKDIYLFDEWAANQDPHFKKIFYEIILQDLKKAGKTIIVISHDEQYFAHGDRVIKLMEGKLI